MFGSQFDDDVQRRKFSRRALLVGAGQMAGFGVLVSHLHQLQVVKASLYAPIADENRINVQLVAPVRGRIFDRGGRLLVGNREGFRAVLIPSLAGSGNLANVLERLSEVIPLSPEERQKLIARARRQQPNVPLIVANDLTFEQIASIGLMAPQLPGVDIEAAATREYVVGEAVAHVVGHVGNVERVAIDDDPVLRLPGMRIGRTGVERGMEERLRGRSGAVKYEVNARGRIVRKLSEVEPVAGDDIALTIDTELQRVVGERLSRERRASAVAIDTSTGDVVLMVSMPTHDPGDIVRGVSARTWAKMNDGGNNPMVNRAIRGLYPPGSTFKMVTALAALEAGVIDLPANGSTARAGSNSATRRSAAGSAPATAPAISTARCAKAATAISTRSPAASASMPSRRWRAGSASARVYDTGIALQKPGPCRTARGSARRFNKPWLGGETLLAGIGQGYVLTTPLQLAVMTARIATGRAVVPQFVRPERGLVPASFATDRPRSEAARRRPPRRWSRSSTRTAAPAAMPGSIAASRVVAGKTGTSQVSRCRPNAAATSCAGSSAITRCSSPTCRRRSRAMRWRWWSSTAVAAARPPAR